jgi:phospholipase/carboxylesterase
MEEKTLRIDEWIVKIRIPEFRLNVPVYLLLHGWTGDENVMWVFADRLPGQALMISPRGIFPTPRGGYGWQEDLLHGWPDLDDLRPAAERVMSLLDRISLEPFSQDVDFSNIHLMGFSQGAALAYTLALLYPQRIKSIIGLAGFLPNKVGAIVEQKPLSAMPVFVAHGNKDAIVPVTRARQAVDVLERAGAKVIYCEDDVGHKLSANCFRSMRHFVEGL